KVVDVNAHAVSPEPRCRRVWRFRHKEPPHMTYLTGLIEPQTSMVVIVSLTSWFFHNPIPPSYPSFTRRRDRQFYDESSTSSASRSSFRRNSPCSRPTSTISSS